MHPLQNRLENLLVNHLLVLHPHLASLLGYRLVSHRGSHLANQLLNRLVSHPKIRQVCLLTSQVLAPLIHQGSQHAFLQDCLVLNHQAIHLGNLLEYLVVNPLDNHRENLHLNQLACQVVAQVDNRVVVPVLRLVANLLVNPQDNLQDNHQDSLVASQLDFLLGILQVNLVEFLLVNQVVNLRAHPDNPQANHLVNRRATPQHLQGIRLVSRQSPLDVLVVNLVIVRVLRQQESLLGSLL